MLLLNRKKISATELSKIFDVSVRTIYRDIVTINHAGIPIVTQTGVKGGISILEEFKMDKYLFSASDAASAMIALTNMYPNLLRNDYAYILAKHKNKRKKSETSENSGTDNKSAVIKITVRFNESHKNYIEERYDLIIVSIDENGYYEACIYIEANEKEYDGLLSIGDKCECTGPHHVRKYIKNKIRSITKIYY